MPMLAASVAVETRSSWLQLTVRQLLEAAGVARRPASEGESAVEQQPRSFVETPRERPRRWAASAVVQLG